MIVIMVNEFGSKLRELWYADSGDEIMFQNE